MKTIKTRVAHPADIGGLPFYNLVQWPSGLFTMQDPAGTHRSVDQRWARFKKCEEERYARDMEVA